MASTPKPETQPNSLTWAYIRLLTMSPDANGFTELLQAHARGDETALDRLFPKVYDELRQMARGRMRHERPDHTLGATELVHEAFFRLVRIDRIDWRSRAHFLAIASQAMRNVLLDHAEHRGAQKRGAGARPVTIERLEIPNDMPADDVIALCEALQRLEKLEPRQARVVECRFFGGLNLDETAEALGISPATVSRDWTIARAWLHAELAASATSESA
jgi:RNA polymerase sigma factor (TIGR02999 family)